MARRNVKWLNQVIRKHNRKVRRARRCGKVKVRGKTFTVCKGSPRRRRNGKR